MRVLLVRLDGIGDAAVCLPLIDALRRAGHSVGAALSDRNAGLFAPGVLSAEHVLERIPWPRHGSTHASAQRARSEIVAARYDAALIASEEPEAFRLARGIAERIGFTTGLARPLKTLWVRGETTATVRRTQHAGRRTEHEVEALFRLGMPLLPSGAAPSSDAVRLRRLLTRVVRPTGRGPLLVQAGPKWRATGVDPAVLRESVDMLRADGAVQIVCAPQDADDVRAAFAAEPRCFSSLRGWVDALDRARAVLTVDSGAAHVAGMLGTPVVDVFPDAHFDVQSARWRPWAAAARLVPASEANARNTTLIEAVRDVA